MRRHPLIILPVASGFAIWFFLLFPFVSILMLKWTLKRMPHCGVNSLARWCRFWWHYYSHWSVPGFYILYLIYLSATQRVFKLFCFHQFLGVRNIFHREGRAWTRKRQEWMLQWKLLGVLPLPGPELKQDDTGMGNIWLLEGWSPVVLMWEAVKSMGRGNEWKYSDTRTFLSILHGCFSSPTSAFGLRDQT